MLAVFIVKPLSIIIYAIDPVLPAIPFNILSNLNTCILSYIYRIFLICKYTKSSSIEVIIELVYLLQKYNYPGTADTRLKPKIL